MRVAVAGSNGLAYSIAHAISTLTYHQVIILSRAVLGALSHLFRLAFADVVTAETTSYRQRVSSRCRQLCGYPQRGPGFQARWPEYCHLGHQQRRPD